MRWRRRHDGRRWLGVNAAVVVAIVLLAIFPSAARAHGGEVNIGVSCMAADPVRPLSRVCTAVVAYLDGDPVTFARLTLSATREGGDERSFGPVRFQPASEDGVYTVAFTYPAYGKWLTRVVATEPGDGEARFQEEVLPPLPGTVGTGGTNVVRIRVVVDFDTRELLNIIVRAVHLGAAAIWFGMSMLVLAGWRFLDSASRGRAMASLARWFPWITAASLGTLALTGSYSAAYSVPTRPPGLFQPGLVEDLPFGLAYLVTFLAKMVLTGAVIATTAALALALRRTYRPSNFSPAAAALVDRRGLSVGVLGALNVVLGVLLFVDVVVLGYLHILTHVGGLSRAI